MAIRSLSCRSVKQAPEQRQDAPLALSTLLAALDQIQMHEDEEQARERVSPLHAQINFRLVYKTACAERAAGYRCEKQALRRIKDEFETKFAGRHLVLESRRRGWAMRHHKLRLSFHDRTHSFRLWWEKKFPHLFAREEAIAWFAFDLPQVAFWCTRARLPVTAIYREVLVRLQAAELRARQIEDIYEALERGEIKLLERQAEIAMRRQVVEASNARNIKAQTRTRPRSNPKKQAGGGASPSDQRQSAESAPVHSARA